MAKENKSRYALLGMLSIRPGSGYDIKKFMEQSTSNFWHESYGQIYPLLKQLVDEGLATSHTRNRKASLNATFIRLPAKGWKNCGRGWLTPSNTRSSAMSCCLNCSLACKLRSLTTWNTCNASGYCRKRCCASTRALRGI